ncbi:hypothetical protein FOCC_FOCC013623 [Frankliniella occidentalis]|nr:hypothetical protein FOCC_FOCC013623 [Frankliniella occidentalis]
MTGSSFLLTSTMLMFKNKHYSTINNSRSTSTQRLKKEKTGVNFLSLRDALDNIFDARVPSAWKRGSWESSTLGFWYAELIERNQQFSTWLYDGRPLMFPDRNETGHNPQPQGLGARSSRHHQHSQQERQGGKEEGVAVYGLFLEGAQWDRRSGILKESHAKVIYSAMPVVVISAGVLSAPRDPKLYMCPVYKKPRRTDLTFITNLWLTSPKSPDHWVLRGVAMLCDTK